MTKILNPSEAEETVLSKLLSLELKGDYHQVIALTLLQDLAKCKFYSNSGSRDYNEVISDNNRYNNIQ